METGPHSVGPPESGYLLSTRALTRRHAFFELLKSTPAIVLPPRLSARVEIESRRDALALQQRRVIPTGLVSAVGLESSLVSPDLTLIECDSGGSGEPSGVVGQSREQCGVVGQLGGRLGGGSRPSGNFLVDSDRLRQDSESVMTSSAIESMYHDGQAQMLQCTTFENFRRLYYCRCLVSAVETSGGLISRWEMQRMSLRNLAHQCVQHYESVRYKESVETMREQRERMRLLKANDMTKYEQFVKQTKNRRLNELLETTEQFLRGITRRLYIQQGHQPEAVEELCESEESQGVADVAKARGVYYGASHRIEEMTVEPKSLVGGKLLPYQCAGLEWLVSLYNNNLHGILADEMGLGKTIQTIALIAYIKENKNDRGPHLIVVPLSTVPNWIHEFQKWAPDIVVLAFRGGRLERRRLSPALKGLMFDVCITTYDFIIREKSYLSHIRWKYLIVDEGHRMKNSKSKLHSILCCFHSSHRLLLTGTPLQNNLRELWSLLNFLLPHMFPSNADFDKWFSEPFRRSGIKDREPTDAILDEEEQLLAIHRLHAALRPFLLRRMKSEVLHDLPLKIEYLVRVPLTCWQEKVYEQLKSKAVSILDSGGKVEIRNIQNTLMQLRKIVNHPYLFLERYQTDDMIYRVSGKFELLDRMLAKLIAFNHRTLIFCQMTQLMGVLGDFLDWRGIRYHRLDGTLGLADRDCRIKEFNDPNCDIQVFMLSTRAGGIGLNLQASDTVVLFDSDYNPHQDLQAMCRAHRVGQKNEVRVFRLLTLSGVEEAILSRAKMKLAVDEKVIQAGLFNARSSEEEREAKLREIITAKHIDRNIKATLPTELNRWLARTQEEEEAFNKFDTKTFDKFWKKITNLSFLEQVEPTSSGSDVESAPTPKGESVPSPKDMGEKLNYKTDLAPDRHEKTINTRFVKYLMAAQRFIAPRQLPDWLVEPENQAPPPPPVLPKKRTIIPNIYARVSQPSSDSESEERVAPKRKTSKRAKVGRKA